MLAPFDMGRQTLVVVGAMKSNEFAFVLITDRAETFIAPSAKTSSTTAVRSSNTSKRLYEVWRANDGALDDTTWASTGR
jgi:hypothetical protein